MRNSTMTPTAITMILRFFSFSSTDACNSARPCFALCVDALLPPEPPEYAVEEFAYRRRRKPTIRVKTNRQITSDSVNAASTISA
jgi:hypothetical protein